MNRAWPVEGDLLASRYRLVTRLETGGMADIWHAEDLLLGRPVALKMPNDLTAARAELLHLAFKEARAAARLSHPHVAAVHDYREAVRADGSVAPFVVMELLGGESLAARLDRGPLPWREAARIGVAVADALAAAHAGGIVHRDVKPGNVMLTPGGGVKILDFGISAATGEPDDDETGATFGTPAYVAPERMDGNPAEPATDVYGLGILLYEMVTGDPPYPVDTWEELSAARVRPPAPLPPGLPAAFRELVTRCLADAPAERPSAVRAREALAQLALGQPASVHPAPAPPRPTHPAPQQPEPARPASHRSALTGSAPTRSAATRSESGPRRPEFPAGRIAAGSVAVDRLARRRPLLRAAAVTAAVAAAGLTAAIGTLHLGGEDRDASPAQPPPPPASAPATSTPSAVPSPRFSAPPSSPPPRSTSSAPPRLDRDEAVGRVRAAVEDGRANGQIRPDVATDLLNLIRNLTNAAPGDVRGRVDELRRKIRERVNEGSVAADRADVLESRLADLGPATST